MTIHDLRTHTGNFQEPTKQDGLAVFRGVISAFILIPFVLGCVFLCGLFLRALVTFFGWGWGVIS